MSESDFCGTGLGNTTAPPTGTPDWSNLAIYAATTNTGIKVSWNTTATLRNAVAYFTVYRNSSNSESGATAIWSGNGTSYHDPSGSLAVGVTYYYWLQCTALNGFSSPWFGPASAAMRTEQDNLVEVMQNQVLSSTFFPELISAIERITATEGSLIANRNELDINDAAISAAIEAVRALLIADGIVNANGFLDLSNEIANVAYRFDVFGAQLGPSIALIQSEQIAYASADEVFAQDISTVEAQLSDPENNGSELFAVVQTNQTAAANADSARASDITDVQAQLDDPTNGIGAIWAGVSLAVNAAVTNALNAQATYSMKVEVDSNGHSAIGGIILGAESDGASASSTVLILADTFGIISPSPTSAGDYIVPFTVGTDDVTGASGVFMDAAYVNNLSVETLQIAGDAVTVGTTISLAPTTSPNHANRKRIAGILTYAYHQGGRIQISASLTAAHGSNAGVYVEIFFNDGSGGKTETVLWDNGQSSGTNFSMSIPCGFTFTSDGGSSQTVKWEIGIWKAGSYSHATVDEITASITVLKR